MTLDEFGLALFDTVRLCAGIEQLRQYKNLPPERIRPGQLTEWEGRERDAVAALGPMFLALAPDEQAEIMSWFPWVARC